MSTDVTELTGLGIYNTIDKLLKEI